VQVDGTCLDIFANPKINASPEQIKRVVGWLDEERRNGNPSMIYQIGLGNLYERAGQDQKAEESYRTVIKTNDPDGVASNNLAWLMALKGRNWHDALDLINQAIKKKGEIADYLDTRGVVYLSAGEGQRAIDDLKAAVDLQPTASKYFHLAQAYLIVNDKANAKKNLEAAKTKGLPIGLHPLEIARYKKVLEELGQ
jgi:Tfp pilus assembly protein PilF